MKKLWLITYLLAWRVTIRVTVSQVVTAAAAFLASEAFDVFIFWAGLLLLAGGFWYAYGISAALITLGAALVLSVKPISRWIR